MAYVVVVGGLSTAATPALIEDLRRATTVPVVLLKEAGTFEPGRIYVANAARWPTVERGSLRLAGEPAAKRQDPSHRGANGSASAGRASADQVSTDQASTDQASTDQMPITRPPSDEGPIDHFLESIAKEYGERAIAVILAGAGDDGAVGVRAIRDLGGFALAQDPDSASPPDMPASAIASGMIEDALPLDALAARVRDYVDLSEDEIQGRGSRSPLRDSSGRKFAARGHQDSTTKSRSRGLDHEDHRRSEVLLRDPQSWLALGEGVIEPLLRSRTASVPIPFRAWAVCGSSGAEAYLLAMLVARASRNLEVDLPVRILASVLDTDLLTEARRGVIPEAAIDELPVEWRQYLVAEGSRYRIIDRLRNHVVFAHHDLFSQAPFSRLDVVVCRDLLSTLDGPMRLHLLQTFHRALNPNGALFLGARETIAAPGSRRWFEATDRRHRIFRALVGEARGYQSPVRFDADAGVSPTERMPTTAARHLSEEWYRASSSRILRQSLADQFEPAAVLTDENLRILFVHGDASDYLSPRRGEPTTDLVAMLPRRLVEPARSAARRALDEKRASLAITESLDGEESIVITVVPVEGHGSTRMLSFTFTPRAPLVRALPRAKTALESPPEWVDAGRGADRSSIPVPLGSWTSVDTDSQRLRAAIDELQLSREELVASREELRTTNEEMEQANARLLVANAELEAQLFQLKVLSDDVVHLLEGTELAAVFLDSDGRVRRFTPAIRPLIRLLPDDIGRPLSDLARNFDDPSLEADLARALTSSLSTEAVTQGKMDRWYLRRVTPFLTKEGADGAVVMFTDISTRQRAEESLRRSNAELEERVRQRTAVAVLLQDVAVIANSAAAMEGAFAAILERLCRDELWVGGHVYLVRAETAEDFVWHESAGSSGTLEAAFGGRSFSSGEGLVGQVIDDGEPRFVSGIDSDPRLARARGRASEVRSIMVFPILAGERVVGAFELFSRGSDAPDAALLEVMRNVGTQIGRVVEREEAREFIFDLAVEEQRSLGEELHDTLSQQVHGLSMLAQSMVTGLVAAGIDETRLRALVDGLLETHQQIRVLSNGLVPVQVEAGGLPAALEEMARGWEQMHGTECVFEHERDGDGDGDDDRVATALYRIAREAARNASLHGDARRVVIRLVEGDGRLTLEIHDDGRGMAKVPEDGPGMGLQIMRHRAEHAGGTLEIESSPGRGTVVRCRIVSSRGMGERRQ